MGITEAEIRDQLRRVLTPIPNRYKIFKMDMTEPHSDEPLGVEELLESVGAPYVVYMSILAAPSAFTFKLNSTDMDEVDAVENLEWDDFEITEIYITNIVGVGTALINVEYRVD